MTDSALSSARRKPYLVGGGSGWMVRGATTTFRGDKSARRSRGYAVPDRSAHTNVCGKGRDGDRGSHGAKAGGTNASCRKAGHRRTTRRARSAPASRPSTANAAELPDMGRRREGDPRLGARRHSSGERRPQAGDQQEAGQRSDHVRRRNRATGCRDGAVQQSGADHQSLNQEPGARRTVCERGEHSLHMYPVFSLRNWQPF